MNYDSYYLWKIKKAILACSKKVYIPRKKSMDFSSIIRDGFWINKNMGNNSFGFTEKSKLYVPPIESSPTFDVEVGDKPLFRDHENGEELCGLKSYLSTHTLKSNTPLFICDNHNYVLEVFELLNKSNNNKNRRIDYDLIHIDQHFDNAKCDSDSFDCLEWRYHTKICDYIDFAKSVNWLKEVVSFVEMQDLNNIEKVNDLSNIILNIDLDFFAPEMSIITLDDKIELIYKCAERAKIITLATSPGFINQKFAIDIAQQLFENL